MVIRSVITLIMIIFPTIPLWSSKVGAFTFARGKVNLGKQGNLFHPFRFSGFTLMEIIVVLLLISLAAGLVAPGIIGGMKRVKASQSAKELVTALRRARTHARLKKVQQRVIFNINDNTYSIEGNNRTISIPDELDIKLHTAQSELQENNIAGIRFFTDGSSTGGRIIMTNDKHTWIINIAWLTGKIALDRQKNE